MVLVCLRTYVMETTCELVTRGLSIVVGNVQTELVLVLNNYRLALHNHLHETSVFMEYLPYTLLRRYQIDSMYPVFLCEYLSY